jgi:hypothetical protein
LPIPQWLIAIPLVGAVLAAILFVSSDPGPLAVGIFILSVSLLMYLYFYVITIWLRPRENHKVLNRTQQESTLPIPRWVIALPALGATAAAILFVSGHTGPLTLILFFVSIFVFAGIYLHLVRVWDKRRTER